MNNFTKETLWDVAVIDPPWAKRKGGKRTCRPNQGRSLDYPTMPIDDIFCLLDKDIFSLASPIHTAFLWSIDDFLVEAENKMLERGYKRHARMIWDKENGIAPAFSVRYSHEYLTWWYKPKFTNVVNEVRGKYTTVIKEKAREHSRKPEAVYSMIEAMFKGKTLIDVFSRQSRNLWLQYGNETEYFNE